MPVVSGPEAGESKGGVYYDWHSDIHPGKRCDTVPVPESRDQRNMVKHPCAFGSPCQYGTNYPPPVFWYYTGTSCLGRVPYRTHRFLQIFPHRKTCFRYPTVRMSPQPQLGNTSNVSAQIRRMPVPVVPLGRRHTGCVRWCRGRKSSVIAQCPLLTRTSNESLFTQHEPVKTACRLGGE